MTQEKAALFLAAFVGPLPDVSQQVLGSLLDLEL